MKANLEDLNIEERTKLEEILAKDPTARSEADNAHLEARAAYLPEEPKEDKKAAKEPKEDK